MAKFKQGQSGNPAGRKKGAINKIAKPIKEQMADFLNEKIQELPEIWKKLSPRDKAQFIKDFWPYYNARLQSVEITGEINFKTLPENQLDILADKLYKKK
ncbi:MAG: DUF5681 domain-containing protein [Bacteroidota bacterium]